MPYYRKVIQIKGEHSPNVRLGRAQLRAGREPTNEMLVPGVLSWADYAKRRSTWDKVKQCIGLDATFWEGAELLLYPCDWLNRAESIHAFLEGKPRGAVAMGVDPAEGGDKTAFAVTDHKGLMDLIAYPTIDTSIIVPKAINLIKRLDLDPRRVCFDRGGGGKQLADELRSRGFPVRTVAFNEAVGPEPDQQLGGWKNKRQRMEAKEEKYPYKDRRAEMYGRLRELIRPPWVPGAELEGLLAPDQERAGGFGLPAYFTELRRQLALIPLKYDQGGRMYLPPKRRKARMSQSERSLEEIIGNSPDEADALVLAVHGLHLPARKGRIGAAW